MAARCWATDKCAWWEKGVSEKGVSEKGVKVNSKYDVKIKN